MEDVMLEQHLENIDRRLDRIEQILPTLATQDQLKALATKEELKALATKDELQAAVALLATKEELRAAVALLATKEDLRREVGEEGERSRRYMTMLIEHQNTKLELLAEHVLSRMPKPPEQ